MIEISDKEFMMGSLEGKIDRQDDERPQHWVKISKKLQHLITVMIKTGSEKEYGETKILSKTLKERVMVLQKI